MKYKHLSFCSCPLDTQKPYTNTVYNVPFILASLHLQIVQFHESLKAQPRYYLFYQILSLY